MALFISKKSLVRAGVVVSAMGLLLSATACSSTAAPASTSKSGSLADEVPASYKTSGVNVAVFNDWAPDEYQQDGKLKGYAIDIAKALSKELDVKFNYKPAGWDVIIPGLASKRFDIAIASIGVTEERLQTLSVIPLRQEGTAYASLTDSKLKIKDISDLCGKSVAVLTGAFDFQYLTDLNAKDCASDKIDVQQFTTQNAAELAVKSKRVQLVAAGGAKLGYAAKQTGDTTVSELQTNVVYNGIGLRKDDAIGKALKDGLAKLIEDGSYAKILAKWGLAGNGELTKAVLATESDPDPKQD